MGAGKTKADVPGFDLPNVEDLLWGQVRLEKEIKLFLQRILLTNSHLDCVWNSGTTGCPLFPHHSDGKRPESGNHHLMQVDWQGQVQNCVL